MARPLTNMENRKTKLWLGLCALPCLWPLFYSLIWRSPGAGNMDLLFFIGPVFTLVSGVLSLGLVAAGLVQLRLLRAGKPALCQRLPLIIGTVIAGLPLVWIAAQVVRHDLAQAKEKRDYKVRQEIQLKKDKWAAYDDRLLPHIIEYVRKHPEKIAYQSGDERAEISGLAAFLSPLVPEIPFSGNDILDPWGKPVFVVIDRNGDALLDCKGLLYGVHPEKQYRLRLGLYSEGMEPYDPYPDDRWRADGGHSPD